MNWSRLRRRALGVARALRSRVSRTFWSRQYVRWVQGRNNRWLGRMLELRGNQVVIDGCRFSIDSAAITTEAKSWFAYGRYESTERRAVRRFLDPRLPIVEFGGGVGVVACIANRRLDDQTKHVVVEANSELVPLLERNRDRNGCGFTILHCAVGYDGASMPFYHHPNFLGGSVRPVAHVASVVPTTTLDAVLSDFGFSRCTLICDIEGGEADLVAHEADVLRERVSLLILEVHVWVLGEEGVANLLARLAALNFERLYSGQETYVLRNRSHGTDVPLPTTGLRPPRCRRDGPAQPNAFRF